MGLRTSTHAKAAYCRPRARKGDDTLMITMTDEAKEEGFEADELSEEGNPT